MSVAVTDTHALIWAATGDLRRLGRAARRFFEQVEADRAALYVPTITLVEIGEALQRGRIQLPIGFEIWTRGLISTGRYHVADLTLAIAHQAQGLFAIPERGDRLIAATAVELGCPLITRDPEIARVAGLEVIW